MKVRALKAFEGTRDKVRGVYPKEGDVWDVSEERADFLKSHGVVEIVEEVSEEVVQAVANAIVEEAEEQNKEVNKIVNEIIEEIPKKKKKRKILK